MGWHLLETLLQQAGEHSTFVGKLWVTTTFMFRFVVVASVGDAVYSDEQSDFTCNTGQPGCENVCFNRFSPISHLRFWAAQLLVVSAPYIIFIVFTLHILMQMPQDEPEEEVEDGNDEMNFVGDSGAHDIVIAEQPVATPTPSRKRRKRGKGRSRMIGPRNRGDHEVPMAVHHSLVDPKHVHIVDEDGVSISSYQFGSMKDENDIDNNIGMQDESKGKEAFIKRSVQAAYIIALLLRTAGEVVFLWLQIVLYGFEVVEIFKCSRAPCPNIVDCFVSRPREKTLFLWFMFAVSIVCIGLCIAEIKYLGVKRIRKAVMKRNVKNDSYSEPTPMIKITGYSDDEKGSDVMAPGNGVTPSAPNPKILFNETNYRTSWDNEMDKEGGGVGFDGRPTKPPRSFPKVHSYNYLQAPRKVSTTEEEEDSLYV